MGLIKGSAAESLEVFVKPSGFIEEGCLGPGGVGGMGRGVGCEEGLSFCSETLPSELSQRSRASRGFRGRPQEAAGAVGPLGQPPSPSQFPSYLLDPQA